MQNLMLFEFAREHNIETLALMDKVREWKLPVRSHMATLDEQMQKELEKRIAESPEIPRRAVTKSARSACTSVTVNEDSAIGSLTKTQQFMYFVTDNAINLTILLLGSAVAYSIAKSDSTRAEVSKGDLKIKIATNSVVRSQADSNPASGII